MKNILLIFFFFPFSFCFGETYIATVPKCGTYLLVKLLHSLKIPFNTQIGPYTHSEKPAMAPHIFHYLETENKNEITLEKVKEVFSPENKYIMIYRDPRDFYISYLNWIERKVDRDTPDEWISIPFKKRLKDAIAYEEDPKFYHLTRWAQHFNCYYVISLIKQRQLPNVFLIKFEDLVENFSTGSRQKQEKVVQDLCSFLGLERDGVIVSQCLDQLYGGTVTFSKKIQKCAQWENIYDDELLSLFKENYGDLLIELEY